MGSVSLSQTVPAVPLVAAVRRSERRRLRLALLLMAPSVIFLAVVFALPIGLFLFRAIDNDVIPAQLPRTLEAVAKWSGKGLPDDKAYAALAQDILALKGKPELALLGRRLNFVIPGYRSLLMHTGRSLDTAKVAAVGAREALIEGDQRWADPAFWTPLRQQSGELTSFYIESALDLRRNEQGELERVAQDRAIFMDLYVRTFKISLGVTIFCLIIGFPVAAVMARAPPTVANLLLTFVLIPFWTSLLVRTTAWVILLQNEGLVNKTLIWSGLIDAPVQLVFNRIGVYVAMVHVLLPYMILPLYSVMRGISPVLSNAAASLGARPFTIFRTVYLPLTMPGIAAGATLVFVLSVGFYVTPALVGGGADQMIGYFIAYFTNSAVNWGLASALGTLLLLLVALLYLVLGWLVGFDRLKVN